jgi:hypothetical protein
MAGEPMPLAATETAAQEDATVTMVAQALVMFPLGSRRRSVRAARSGGRRRFAVCQRDVDHAHCE